MPIDQTLARVEADLARGDAVMACQRLRGLVGSFPDRLDLREHLAEVYRQRGFPAEAGRWSYLSEQRDPVEVAAFEKRTRTALARMFALSWSQDPQTASTETARRRLAELLDQARRELHDPNLTYENLRQPGYGQQPQTWRDSLFVFAVLAVLALLAGLLLIGILDGVHVVWSWIT